MEKPPPPPQLKVMAPETVPRLLEGELINRRWVKET